MKEVVFFFFFFFFFFFKIIFHAKKSGIIDIFSVFFGEKDVLIAG